MKSALIISMSGRAYQCPEEWMMLHTIVQMCFLGKTLSKVRKDLLGGNIQKIEL